MCYYLNVQFQCQTVNYRALSLHRSTSDKDMHRTRLGNTTVNHSDSIIDLLQSKCAIQPTSPCNWCQAVTSLTNQTFYTDFDGLLTYIVTPTIQCQCVRWLEKQVRKCTYNVTTNLCILDSLSDGLTI